MQSEDIIKRLEFVFEYFGLTASSFADKINVQRSSISHLLSGRNKPSLDFILKIVEHFPEVDIMWLLKGVGEFPKSTNSKIQSNMLAPALSYKDETSNQHDLFSVEESVPKNELFENVTETISNTPKFERLENNKDIDQIVIFYKDGSFKLYK